MRPSTPSRTVRYLGRWQKVVVPVGLVLVGMITWIVVDSGSFVRPVSVQFDWERSGGFRSIYVRHPSLGPLYSDLIAAQAKSHIASEFEKAGWISGKGHWNVQAFCLLYVLGIDHRENWDIETIDPTVTPLMQAARDGDLSSIKRIVASGGNVETRDQEGRTALMHAAIKGREQAAKLLLEAGADPNVSDKSGQTPFLWAAATCQQGLGMALVAAGADVDAKDAGGISPLDYTRCPAVVQKMIAARTLGSKTNKQRPGG